MKKQNAEKFDINKKASLLTGASYWRSASVEGEVRSVRFSDGPSGVRAQGKRGDYLGVNGSFPATCYPSHSALSCSWNENLCEKIAGEIAEEAKFFGVDVLLAPDLNIKRNPLCGRNFEYFSEDPYLNGRLGAAYVGGLRAYGVGSCVKHFAANNAEFGRMVCDSVVDARTLREIYLTPFEIAVKSSQPEAVMTAYNKVNGVYCNENAYLLDTVLRGEWGFNGAVISDWGGTHDRIAAVKAGADLEMPSCEITHEEIRSAIKAGILTEDDIDKCARRIVRLASVVTPRARECNFSAHAETASAAAAECAVLLKNDGTLPLDGKGKTVLVGGFADRPLIQGGGSSKVNPKNRESLRGCLHGTVDGFAYGYKTDGKHCKRREKRALKLCAEADNVIYCMGLPKGDREAVDRKDLSLPENQTELLKKIYSLGKKVIVVLYCGCVVDTSWDNGASALLLVGLAGQGGARAAADILTGKANPSGKLTETFPLNLADVPSSEYFGKSPYYTVYGEGMQVGYRYFSAHPEKIKYPFGYGLSYTRFVYSGTKTESGGISFNIKNEGEADGAEAAQLYVRFPDGANAPFIQLKGFTKIFLRAGESKKAFIPFDEYTFRSYDGENSRWVEVAGKYTFYIGASSQDMRLIGVVERKGAHTSVPAEKTDGLTPSVCEIKRDAKGRVIADEYTPLCELKNAVGIAGRVFSGLALFAVRGKDTVYGSMRHLPLRTLAQFGGFKRNTLRGMILMFNGKFFKGLNEIFSNKTDGDI